MALQMLAVASGNKPRFQVLAARTTSGVSVPLLIRCNQGHTLTTLAWPRMYTEFTPNIGDMVGEVCHVTTRSAAARIAFEGLKSSYQQDEEGRHMSTKRIHVHLLPCGPEDPHGRVPLALPRGRWEEADAIVCIDPRFLAKMPNVYINTTGTLLSVDDVPAEAITKTYVTDLGVPKVVFDRTTMSVKYEQGFYDFKDSMPDWAPSWAKGRSTRQWSGVP